MEKLRKQNALKIMCGNKKENKSSQVKQNLFNVSLNLSLWMKLRFHDAWGGLAGERQNRK